MTQIIHYRPDSDDYDAVLRGRARAERINDIRAKSGTAAHDEYLALIAAQAAGEAVVDHDDRFRYSDDRWAAIGRALRLYLRRDHPDDPKAVKGGVVYLDDEFPLACAPHAVDSGLIVIQVHLRESAKTYERAVARGIDNDMFRVSQAQMALTDCIGGLHINYYCAPDGTEHWQDHAVRFDRRRAEELRDEMLAFAMMTRFAAQENAA